MGNNIICCQHYDNELINDKGHLTQVSLVQKPRQKKQQQHQMMFNSSFRDYQVTNDPILEFVLNDTEIRGRKGFAKIEIIEKLQAVFRGAIVRRRMKLLRYIIQLQDKVYEKEHQSEQVCQAIKERGAYQWIRFNQDESSFQVGVTHVYAVELPKIKLTAVAFKELQDEKGQYIGFVNKQTQEKQGLGVLFGSNGSLYEGLWQSNMANGSGRMVHNDGDIYEGEWFNDKNHGHGYYYQQKDGINFEGTWFEDTQSGSGHEEWPDKTTYTGQYHNGKKQGKGTLRWSDGSLYEGEFQDNYIHGQGSYQWSDGRSYVGGWHLNMMQGRGVFKWADGRKYEGDYYRDLKHGKGKITWPCGKYYDGQWVNGVMDGFGTFKDSSPQSEERMGEWREGKRLRWIDRA